MRDGDACESVYTGKRGIWSEEKKHAEKGMCIPASSKRVHIISSARIVESITGLCGCQVEVMRKNAIEQNLRQKSHSG